MELEKGRSIQFHYVDWTDGIDLVRVITIPSIGFIDAAAQPSRVRPARVAVYFATNSTELTQPAISALNGYYERFTKLRITAKILVTAGSADPRGTQKYNRGLARRRAEQVRNHLVSLGVPIDLIGLRRVEESWQEQSREDPESYAYARRVTLEISEVLAGSARIVSMSAVKQ